ncbi:MAG: hypothetical protein ACLRUN_14550 [Christensenellales bacterium]
MEENQKKESFRKKAELLLHHLKPAASAFALGIGASLAATLLRTLLQIIVYRRSRAAGRNGGPHFC